MIITFSLFVLQYYSTMLSSTNPVWLSRKHVEDTTSYVQGPVADMLSRNTVPPVGGVISEISQSGDSVELQRVISRCKCQLFYASYGEVDADQMKNVPPMVR